jgi:hypothetical protein
LVFPLFSGAINVHIIEAVDMLAFSRIERHDNILGIPEKRFDKRHFTPLGMKFFHFPLKL